LLDGATGPITNVAIKRALVPADAGGGEHAGAAGAGGEAPTQERWILALCTQQLAFVIRLQPSVQLLHRIAAPVDLPAVWPCLAWRDSTPVAPVVATAVSALDLLRPGSLTPAEPGLAAAPDLAAPLLVVAWGCQLQLLQLFHEQPAGSAAPEDAAGAAMRIEQLGRYEGDAEIISLAWLRSGPLLALDSRHFLHAFDAEIQARAGLCAPCLAPHLLKATSPPTTSPSCRSATYCRCSRCS